MSREKIALLFFALILVVGFGALLAYVFLGHSLNVVASKVDDAAHDMNGYAVVLFEGTDVPDARSGDFSEDPVVSLASAKAGYESKKANVLTLDTVSPQIYREPAVYQVGCHRVGVIYLDQLSSKQKDLKKAVLSLDGKCDFVVAISPSTEIADSYLGVDIAIDLGTQQESADYYPDIMSVESAGVGNVSAIVISPSGVVSNKVVQSK